MMVASIDPATSVMHDTDHIGSLTTYTVKSFLVDYMNDGTNDAHVRVWLTREYAYTFVYEFIMSVFAVVEDSESMSDDEIETVWSAGYVRDVVGDCIDFAYAEPYALSDNSPESLGEKFFAVRNSEISYAEAGTDFFGREDLYEIVKGYGSIDPY